MLRKVLMTADAVGGVWRYAVDLSSGVASQGVEILLAVMGPPPNQSQRAEARAVPSLNLIEGSFALEWMPEPWADVERAGEWLLEAARWFKPDLVHLNGYSHAALDWQAPVLVAAHSCVWSWWRAVHKTTPPPDRQSYYQAVRRGLAAADYVVAPSRAMLSSLRCIYNWWQPADVIHNGSSVTPSSAPKKPIVFAAGRLWDEAKNILALTEIEAWSPWPIYIAGSGAGTVPPTTGANLQYLGFLSQAEMMQWYSRAAIFAAPAKYEPFGLSILEAARSRCALILADIESLRELWNDAAVFVNPESSAELLAAIEKLARDAHSRQIMAEKASIRASCYTQDRMTASYLAAYQRATCRTEINSGARRCVSLSFANR